MESGDDVSIERKKKIKQNEEDMIISLPEPIVHHILSFLDDMKHVVKTSILSRKWRYIWMSHPFLNFDYQLFLSPKPKRKPQYADEKRFKNFVDNILLLRDTSDINYFRISTYHSASCCYIDDRIYTWILHALRRNVQKLILEFSTNALPHCLFTSRSLRVLELNNRGEFKLSLPYSLSLPSLKTLYLENFEINDVLATRIFISCPVLKSLILLDCDFPSDIEFHAPNLERLDIYDQEDFEGHGDKTLKLYAPKLLSLCIRCYTFKDYLFIENLSSLVKARIDCNLDFLEIGNHSNSETREEYQEPAQRAVKFLTAFHNVNVLELTYFFLETVSGALHLLNGTSVQFCNLTYLKMEVMLSRDINAVTYLLKISPNIESLFLDFEEYWDEDRVNSASTEDYVEVGELSQCMLDHLKFVDVQGVKGCLNELMFLELLLKNAMVLEELILQTCKEQSPQKKCQLVEFKEKLLTSPRASSRLAILLL